MYTLASTMSEAFDHLLLEMVALEQAWSCDRERSGLRHAAGDVRHHVCSALAFLDDMLRNAERPAPHAMHEVIDDARKVLAHEAYLSALSLGQLLRRASEDRLADAAAIERGQRAVARLLDELTPYVSRADDGLRRVLLDDEPFETALARVGHG